MADKYYDESQVQDIIAAISNKCRMPVLGAGGGFAPIGTEAYFDGQVAPLGWVICDGTELNIADYPDLATYYASQHGASNYYGGDGITTFAVPVRNGMPTSGVDSPDEHIVGEVRKTIDGVKKCKPVYKKTINFGNNISTSTSVTTLSGDFSYIDELIESTSILHDTSEGWVNLSAEVQKLGNNLRFRSAFNWGNESTRYIIITICYTKTTDSWQLVQEGHSADGNGVFCVKATLSDAEINAFDVYTPREHQVAWWEEEIDGVWKRKPVYERTWKYNKTGGEVVIFDCDDYDIEHIFVTDTHTMNSNAFNGVGVYYNYATDKSRFFRSPDNKMVADTGTDYMNGTSYATFRYTKTTDDWQTS